MSKYDDLRRDYRFKSEKDKFYTFNELVKLKKIKDERFDNYLLYKVDDKNYEKVVLAAGKKRKPYIRSYETYKNRLNNEYHSSEGEYKTHEWAIYACNELCNKKMPLKVKIDDEEYVIYPEKSHIGHRMKCYSSMYVPDLVITLDKSEHKNDGFIKKYGFILYMEFMYTHKVPASKKEEFRLQNFTMLEYEIDKSLYISDDVSDSEENYYIEHNMEFFSNNIISLRALSVYQKGYKALPKELKEKENDDKVRCIFFGNEEVYYINRRKNTEGYYVTSIINGVKETYFNAFLHVTEKKDFKALPFETVLMAEMYINYLHNYFSKK